MMLTTLKASPGPETTAYYDWALVDIGDPARASGVYNVPKTTKFGIRSLTMPPSRGIDDPESFPITVMSSEGPKNGTISFLPSRLLLSPGRAFVNTYMIKLYEPYCEIVSCQVAWPVLTVAVITHGDFGSWVVNRNSGQVYGHLVAADVLGGGHVVPLLDTIDDIKERLGATSVVFPDSNRVTSIAA